MKKAEYVEWRDSGMFQADGWQKRWEFTQAKGDLHTPARSVGFVLHEDKDTLILSTTHDKAHDAYFGAQFIAKSNIVKRKKVRV